MTLLELFALLKKGLASPMGRAMAPLGQAWM